MDQFITKRKRIQNELDSDSESERESEKSAIEKKTPSDWKSTFDKQIIFQENWTADYFLVH